MNILSSTVTSNRINVLPATGDVSSPANGDIWYNSSTGKFRKQQGGSTTDMDTTGGGAGLTWTVVTGTTQTGSTNNGYFSNNAATVAVTLPSTAAVGDQFNIAGMGAGGWSLSQASGQTIHFGNTNTTTGATGSLASTNRGDVIQLVCSVANTDFIVISSIGNITIV